MKYYLYLMNDYFLDIWVGYVFKGRYGSKKEVHLYCALISLTFSDNVVVTNFELHLKSIRLNK